MHIIHNIYCLYSLSDILSLAALDVSADLIELGRTPIAVVSAGVKSILDIGRTLEFLVCAQTHSTFFTRFHVNTRKILGGQVVEAVFFFAVI